MLDLKEKLIVALDVPTLDKAEELVDKLCEKVKFFKVGSQLFTTYGPRAVEMVAKKGAKVFLDLKFYDIPNTVFQAVSSGTGLSCEPVLVSTGQPSIAEDFKKAIQPAVFMMTVHARGGTEMLKAAVKGATEKASILKITKPFIVGVTRLTSDEGSRDIKREVLEAAKLARLSGLDGVVCSAQEAPIVRREFGKDFLIVAPGIRPKGYRKDDQSRIATAQEAIEAGADFIVVGRPILEAKDPVKALTELL
jgi:orotidine-5'-phosphate decarboxylase